MAMDLLEAAKSDILTMAKIKGLVEYIG